MTTLPEARPGFGMRRQQLDSLLDRVRYPLTVYAMSRALLALVVLAVVLFQPAPLGRDLANWDGQWYLKVFQVGYPPVAYHAPLQQTTLGFLPLYPMVMWLVANVFLSGPTVAGMAIALICGGIVTVQVDMLAREWWGDDDRIARRVVTFFCFFPGTIVFSMVYTEGLLLSLICGCILALRHGRWLLAGVLAAFSTAIGPVAEAIIPTCIIASGLELYRYGWRDRDALRSLIAPILSPVGLIGFGIYLWFRTGTPLASYYAQRYGWQESTTPLAIWRMFRSLYYQVRNALQGHAAHIDLNLVAGVYGTLFLVFCLYLIWRDRRQLGTVAITWTLFVSLLAVTSAKTPPNARLLLCAFPAVMIFGAKIGGKRTWIVTMAITVTLLILMSYLTYSSGPGPIYFNDGPLRP